MNRKKPRLSPGLIGGERGIRTPDRVTPILVFETSAFNRSATSPNGCLRVEGGPCMHAMRVDKTEASPGGSTAAHWSEQCEKQSLPGNQIFNNGFHEQFILFLGTGAIAEATAQLALEAGYGVHTAGRAATKPAWSLQHHQMTLPILPRCRPWRSPIKAAPRPAFWQLLAPLP